MQRPSTRNKLSLQNDAVLDKIYGVINVDNPYHWIAFNMIKVHSVVFYLAFLFEISKFDKPLNMINFKLRIFVDVV